MAIQTSGEISINDIYRELTGNDMPNDSDITLEDLCLGNIEPLNPDSTNQPTTSAPFDIQSWYGYDHSESGDTALSMTVYYGKQGYVEACGESYSMTIYYEDRGLRIEDVGDLYDRNIPIYVSDDLTNTQPALYFKSPGMSVVYYWDGGNWASTHRCNA